MMEKKQITKEMVSDRGWEVLENLGMHDLDNFCRYPETASFEDAKNEVEQLYERIGYLRNLMLRVEE